MLKKFGLAVALVLVTGFTRLPSGPQKSSTPVSGYSESCEARLEQQKSKWAPNGMKVLIIHSKRRWVDQAGWPHVEKFEKVPILKGGV